LPVTGLDSGALAGLGCLLVIAGIGLRRRRIAITLAIVSLPAVFLVAPAYAAPPNDLFAAAQEIDPAGLPVSLVASNVDATFEQGEPDHANRFGEKSIWFRFEPEHAGVYEIDLSGSTHATPGFGELNTLLGVYQGPSLNSLITVAYNNDQSFEIGTSKTQFHVAPGSVGTPYFIAVDGFLGSTGEVHLAMRELTSPPNDNREDAAPLTGALPISATGTNVGATSEPFEPAHWSQSKKASVWYEWTAPGNGIYEVDLAGSDFDTILAVYNYNEGAIFPYELVASNDDSSSGTIQSRAGFEADANEEFVIAVDGYEPNHPTGNIQLELREAQRPPNDYFANAIAFAPSPTFETKFDHNTFASKEPGEPNHGGHPGGQSLWYEWTPSADGFAYVDTGGDPFVDTVLGMYTGETVDDLTLVAENDNHPEFGWPEAGLRLDVEGGTTYRIAVDTKFPNHFVSLTIQHIPFPPNDDFADAEELSGIATGASADNHEATVQQGEPAHAGRGPFNSVWYEWTAPQGGTVALDTLNSDLDSVLAVYTGDAPGALSPVAANDDAGPGEHHSAVSFAATAGTTYRIAVASAFDDLTDEYELFLELTPGATGGAAPETELTNAPRKVKTKKRKAKVRFEFVSAPAGAAFECSLDGSPFKACTSPHTVKAGVGKHALSVRAVGAEGAVDATPALASFKVKRKRR
jgi:hypothetical protein